MLAAFGPFRDQYTEACFDATVLDPERIVARMEEGPVFVAEANGLVGTIGCMLDDRGLYTRGMAVHPAAQRGGIGRALLDRCKAYAQTMEAPCMWLSTTLFLDASIALYQSYGFHDAPGPGDLGGTPLRSFELPLAPAD